MHSRIDRVQNLVQENIAEIIDQLVTDPRVPPFTTVSSVKVTKDLRSAQVFVTFMNDEDPENVKDAIAALNTAAGFIRSELGRRITLRYLPALRFHYNPSTRYAAHIQDVFERIAELEPDDQSPEVDSEGEQPEDSLDSTT